jgi:hypothetical protein
MMMMVVVEEVRVLSYSVFVCFRMQIARNWNLLQFLIYRHTRHEQWFHLFSILFLTKFIIFFIIFPHLVLLFRVRYFYFKVFRFYRFHFSFFYLFLFSLVDHRVYISLVDTVVHNILMSTWEVVICDTLIVQIICKCNLIYFCFFLYF